MTSQKYYIDPNIDFSYLKNKILYYPCSGEDYYEPISLFRDIIDEFWFVDNNYFKRNKNKPIEIKDLSFKSSKYFGNEKCRVEERYTECGKKYRYIEPFMRKDFYKYKGRLITIVRRRGFGYNSLFGPSTLEIAEKRLGIFFYRGDSMGEGGSGQTWISNKSRWMISGKPKVSLLSMVIKALPDGGILATDGSNAQPFGKPHSVDKDYLNLSKFLFNRDIIPKDAFESSNNFSDSKGNTFICIGYASFFKGPTIIWKIDKS